MTLPNRLTVARLFAAPLVFTIWFFLFDLQLSPKAGSICLWILFIGSELTDILDGYFARRRSQVSDIGKLLDPFSDIFLCVTYFVFFLHSGIMPVWTFMLILWREFGMLFLRAFLALKSHAFPARPIGKVKTVFYVISSIGGLAVMTFRIWLPDAAWLPGVEVNVSRFFVFVSLLSVFSFVDYLLKSRNFQGVSKR